MRHIAKAAPKINSGLTADSASPFAVLSGIGQRANRIESVRPSNRVRRGQEPHG